MADQPQLGYGQRAETSIDAFNQWFRSQPAYYAKLAEFGQDPNNVHLNDQQKQEMVKLAQSLGAVVDEGHNGQEVDDSGNFRAKSHALRNTLIVAGIAAAALITAGAAGAFGGAAAGGGAGAGAVSEGTLASLGTGAGAAAADVGAGALAPAVAGSVLPSTAIGSGFIPGIAGGTGTALSGVGAGVGASTVASTAAAPVADYATNAAGVVTQAASVPAEAGGIGATIGKIANSSWFPVALGVGGQLAGAAIQSNASEHAADLQSQAAKDALDFAKSQAAIERQNFAPYLAAGTGALSKLSFGLGIGDPGDYNSNGMPATPPGGSPGSITPGYDPQVSPHSPAAQFIADTRTQPVWITAPTGERRQVPANQVQKALDLGGKIDPGQGQSGSLSTLGRMAPTGAPTIGTATARM